MWCRFVKDDESEVFEYQESILRYCTYDIDINMDQSIRLCKRSELSPQFDLPVLLWKDQTFQVHLYSNTVLVKAFLASMNSYAIDDSLGEMCEYLHLSLIKEL